MSEENAAQPLLGIDSDGKMEMTVDPVIHHMVAKIKFDKSVVDQLNKEIDEVSILNSDSHQSKLVGQFRQDERSAQLQMDLTTSVGQQFKTVLNSAGTSYLAAVRGEVHPTDTVGISTSGNDNTVSYIQDNGCDIGTGGFGYWYGGSGYLIRMNFGPAAWVLGTAINDVENSQFNVYPNPTNGLFTIELDGNSKYVVSVKNVLGQTVFTTTTNGMNTNIDLSSFDKGIYTVELKDENAIYTEKVIVE